MNTELVREIMGAYVNVRPLWSRKFPSALY